MENVQEPQRRRRRRQSQSTDASDANQDSASNHRSPSGAPQRDDVLEAGDAGGSPERQDMDQSPEQARRNQPEMPTSEEEEDAPGEEGPQSSLLPSKRVEAARKTQRDNTTPLPNMFKHVHMIGEIDQGVGFPAGAFVKWTVVTGDRWELVRGTDSGRTFQDASVESLDGEQHSVWAHPIDIYFAASPQDLRGQWPKLLVQVVVCDSFGIEQLAGYGVSAIPLVPGTHQLEIPTWRPCGNASSVLTTAIMGTPLELMSDDTVLDGDRRRDLTRYHIANESSGTVYASMSVLVGTRTA